MGSVIFRPTDTINNEHSVYPANSVPNKLVDDITPDGDSTYLQLSVNSTNNVSANSLFVFSGKLPSKSAMIKNISVHVNAKCSTTSLSNRRVNVVFEWIEALKDNNLFNINTSLGTSYTDSSANIPQIIPYIQELVQDDGSLSFQMTVRSVGAKSSGKNASSGTIRITQVYIVIDYEDEKLMIKTNGQYITISKMYEKENGAWIERDAKEFFQNKKNNTKFEYIYGGDIE